MSCACHEQKNKVQTEQKTRQDKVESGEATDYDIFRLGTLYSTRHRVFSGEIYGYDLDMAVKYFKMGVDRLCPDSMVSLGILCDKGWCLTDGRPTDNISEDLFNQSIDAAVINENPEVLVRLGQHIKKNENSKCKLIPSQLFEQAITIGEKKYLKPDNTAVDLRILGDLYNSIDRNDKRKIPLYELYISRGEKGELNDEHLAAAKHNLAFWYSKFLGCEKTYMTTINSILIYSSASKHCEDSREGARWIISCVLNMDNGIDTIIYCINNCKDSLLWLLAHIFRASGYASKSYKSYKSIFERIHDEDPNCLTQHKEAITSWTKDYFNDEFIWYNYYEQLVLMILNADVFDVTEKKT